MLHPGDELYADEHISRAVIRGLQPRGVDVLTVTDAGLLAASDEEHIQRARVEGRVVFTQDTDFLRLHAAGVEYAGIIYAPRMSSIGEVIRGLMVIQQVLEAVDMIGASNTSSSGNWISCCCPQLRFPWYHVCVEVPLTVEPLAASMTEQEDRRGKGPGKHST